jgi:GNAT superfamily N-acetyltransferase
VSDLRFDCPGRQALERDAQWWEIYRDSIPGEERESPSIILDSLERGIGMAFRARVDGTTIGIATTHLLLNPAAVFLVYLAVRRDRRGAGCGGDLLEYAWTRSLLRMRERGCAPLGMIWEVDPPDSARHPNEVATRRRRMTFFERHGGVPAPGGYVQPPLSGGEPVPMRLMFRSAAKGSMLDGTAADALVRAMYFEKYGKVNGISEGILNQLLERRAV